MPRTKTSMTKNKEKGKPAKSSLRKKEIKKLNFLENSFNFNDFFQGLMGKIILSLFVFLIVFALNILLSANNLSTFLLLLGFESLVMLILFFSILIY